mmetsp:Transcript_19936/g.25683  ORF Transcript_19936/g.25683 Transcript_19936/m.25683 type:complete len:206 (-) Transcript_19936:390-1007(-)
MAILKLQHQLQKKLLFLLFLGLQQLQQHLAWGLCDICGCPDAGTCAVGLGDGNLDFMYDGTRIKFNCATVNNMANSGTTVFSAAFCADRLPTLARLKCACYIISSLDDLPQVFDPLDPYGLNAGTTTVAPGSPTPSPVADGGSGGTVSPAGAGGCIPLTPGCDAQGILITLPTSGAMPPASLPSFIPGVVEMTALLVGLVNIFLV